MLRTLRISRCVASVTFALAIDAIRVAAQVSPAPPPGLPPRQSQRAPGTSQARSGGSSSATTTATSGPRHHGPVLDLRTYAGGLTPTRIGGSKQTKSLAFESSNGDEFVFRLVDKDGLNLPAGYEHTIVEKVAAARSARFTHPAQWRRMCCSRRGCSAPESDSRRHAERFPAGEFREISPTTGNDRALSQRADSSAGFRRCRRDHRQR